MKILPKIYRSAVGEPFRVETYDGKKIEFYRLEDTQYLIRYASKGRFAIWTSNGEDFRVFVETGYYEECEELYQNEINEIWIDYTHFVYQTQKKTGRKFNLISIISMVPIFALTLLLSSLNILEESTAFIIGMVVVFIAIFFITSQQQKRLTAEVRGANLEATNKIKAKLGTKRFEGLLDKQRNYYYKFMEIENPEDQVEEELHLDEKNEAIETEALEIEENIESNNDEEDINE